MKINKYFFITLITIFILIGYIPGFPIKYAPSLELTGFQAFIDYFYKNLFQIWGYKLVVSLIIAFIVNTSVNKKKISKNMSKGKPKN